MEAKRERRAVGENTPKKSLSRPECGSPTHTCMNPHSERERDVVSERRNKRLFRVATSAGKFSGMKVLSIGILRYQRDTAEPVMLCQAQDLSSRRARVAARRTSAAVLSLRRGSLSGETPNSTAARNALLTRTDHRRRKNEKTPPPKVCDTLYLGTARHSKRSFSCVVARASSGGGARVRGLAGLSASAFQRRRRRAASAFSRRRRSGRCWRCFRKSS